MCVVGVASAPGLGTVKRIPARLYIVLVGCEKFPAPSFNCLPL